jgi:hypothetical protein
MQNMPNKTLDSLPWQEISELINSEKFLDKFAAIPTETLEFAIDEDNYQVLVESALESLKVSVPEKANLEYAAKIADTMKDFASQVLLERTSN